MERKDKKWKLKIRKEEIIHNLKEELDYEDQWVYGVGLKLKELEGILKKGTGTIRVRVLVKMEEVDLVYGAEVDLYLELGE